MSLQTSLDLNFKEFGEYYPQFFHGLAATERVSEFEHRTEEPAIYTTTNLENNRYGKPDASDEEVIEAARKADAYEFIMEQEHGFATCVGENAVRLSGEQKNPLSPIVEENLQGHE